MDLFTVSVSFSDGKQFIVGVFSNFAKASDAMNRKIQEDTNDCNARVPDEIVIQRFQSNKQTTGTVVAWYAPNKKD